MIDIPGDTIDLRLPLCTEAGDPVIITHTFTACEAEEKYERFVYVGMIKLSPKIYRQEWWDQAGNPRSGNSEHQLKNAPGFHCTEVHLNIYQDGTTGYGYLSEATARKYAPADNHLPVLARVNETIIYKESQH